MTTMLTVINRARAMLNDSLKVRYLDDQLLAFANAGINRAGELRPDLRFGQYGVTPVDLTLESSFPYRDKYFQAIVDYTVARAYLIDGAEANNAAAAAAFNQLFEHALIA